MPNRASDRSLYVGFAMKQLDDLKMGVIVGDMQDMINLINLGFVNYQNINMELYEGGLRSRLFTSGDLPRELTFYAGVVVNS